MKKFKSLLCILLALVMVIALVGCGKTNAPAADPGKPADSGKTPSGTTTTPAPPPADDPTSEYVKLNVGVTSFLGAFLQGLQPAESPTAGNAVFDQTFVPDPETHTIYSDCLTEWHWEDDTTFIMVLNPNVVFSNGDKATSEDLLFSYTSFFDRVSSELSGWGLVLDECKTRDEYTVQLKFEKPFRFVVNTRVNLIDKSWAESVGWDSTEWYTPVASGPYTCTEYVPDDHMVLKARDDYWNAAEKGPIYVDEYHIQYYKDTATMNMDLEAGVLDLSDSTATDYSRFVKNGGDGFSLITVQTGCTYIFSPDIMDFDTWKDKRMREAVAIGINWEEVGRASAGDLYVEANSLLPKASPYYIDPGKYEYNPEKAKELIQECGYGPDNHLSLHIVQMDSAGPKATAENIQFQMSQLYIDVEIEFMDVPSAAKQWSTPGTTSFGFNSNPAGSPTFDLYDNLSRARMTRNYWFYRDIPEFNDLFEKMVNTVDPEVWTKAMKDLQQYVFDEIIYIPIYEGQVAIGYRPDKLTEAQVRSVTASTNSYVLDKLGYLSSWQ